MSWVSKSELVRVDFKIDFNRSAVNQLTNGNQGLFPVTLAAMDHPLAVARAAQSLDHVEGLQLAAGHQIDLADKATSAVTSGAVHIG
jgi:hypothetical protein